MTDSARTAFDGKLVEVRPTAAGGALTSAEIASQPVVWRQALQLVDPARSALAALGERVLFIGCGTSAFVAQAMAELREAAGFGESHWAYASEFPVGRTYQRVVAITRSGTTSEVVDALRQHCGMAWIVAVTAVGGMPAGALADEELVLDFADERSVVQTRFPTTVLALARAAFGENVDELPEACERALAGPVPIDVTAYEHFVHLGRSWTLGLAHEAALKIRESAQAWAESYPALDYRHGPIAVAGPRSLVWFHTPPPEGLVEDVEAVGATAFVPDVDPLVSLVLAQRVALEVARSRGLDPDRPRHLTRSVLLESR